MFASLFFYFLLLPFALVGSNIVCAQDLKSSWQVEWERTVEAAKGGDVVIYAPANPDYERWLKGAFQKAHPDIRLIYNGGRLSQLAHKILAERRAQRYLVDLVIGGTTIPNFILKPAGALEPIRPALILPEVIDTSAWFRKTLWFSDIEEKFNVVWEGTAGGSFAINKNLAKPEEFSTLWDVLGPKWRGKIVAQDPRTPGRGYSASVFLYNSRQYGSDFLRRLFSQMDVTLTRDTHQMMDWLGKGKFAIGLFGTDIEKAVHSGLPIVQVQPGGELPLTHGVASASLLNRAPHPQAAKVLLNWMLSREGQIAFQKITAKNSLRTDIPKKDSVDLSEVPKEDREYIMQNFEKYERAALEPLKRLFDEVIRR